jgi:lipopolysaccharide cholinephosphotransferase
MRDDELIALQAILTRLLRHFDEACKAAGARFYLDAGTLLGAVRYGDWIPWDDDMDVVMWRTEYERLRTHLAQHPGSQTFLWDPLHEPGSGVLPRFTVVDSTVIVSDYARVGHPERARVCLDVFIIDDAPESIPLTWLWLQATHILQIARLLKGSSARRLADWRPAPLRIALSGAAVLLTPIPEAWIQRIYRNTATAFAGRSRTGFVLNGGRQWRRTRIPRAWFADANTVRFAGSQYSAPDTDAYLSSMYGSDYMTPPPPQERTDHDLTMVDARLDDIEVRFGQRHPAERDRRVLG